MMKSICIIVVVIIFANVSGEDFLHSCPSGELLCGDRQKCVPTSALCNYVQDCDDLSDEINLKLCKKIRKHQSKCDPGMVACNDFTVHKSDTNINGNNNDNNNYDDYDPYSNSWRRRITTTTTTTTTTEAPILSRYPFLSNQCLDVITACVIGKDCLGDDHTSLCQKITGQKLSGLGTKIFSTSTDIEDMYTLMKEISEGMEDISNGTCPYFHTFFEGKCIWGLPIKTTWYEAEEICKSIGSELAVVKDFDSLRLIRNFIKTGPIGTNFWIGGNYMTSSDGSSGVWKWINGSEITNDLIFWSLRSYFMNSSQNRPTNIQIGTHQFNEGSDGKCLAILSKNFYLFSDEDCNLRFSPLCVKEANTKEASVRESSVREASTKEAIVIEASTKEPSVREASTKEAIIRKVSITEANVKPLEVGDASFGYIEPPDYLDVVDAPLRHQLPPGYVYL